MTLAWVLGQGGLLGQAVVNQLQRQSTACFRAQQALDWSNLPRLCEQMHAAVVSFADQVRAHGAWEIYWCAGVGTMASQACDLEAERVALEALVAALRQQRALMSMPGRFALASSAGAVHAGCEDAVVTECSPTCATTAYAQCKLGLEATVASLTEGPQAQVSVLVARFSTLFGVGQHANKKQGLLTHMARQAVRHQPIQIFVAYDTVRDYLSQTDAALRMIAANRAHQAVGQSIVKIIASERPTSVAEIIAMFQRLTRRRLRVSRASTADTALYQRSIRFRSEVLPLVGLPEPLNLAVGLHDIMQAEFLRYARGEPHA